ncbi:hypothetical protein [Streptomyces sp. CA-106131]|uniref:hypothetical protein n=1 Tax=Streptomyces sp. CA-106131 TaxID=3240045 RepID=UPI003D948AC1
MRRAQFVDVGRFTAGVWPVIRTDQPLIFGVAFARHYGEADAPRCGLEVVVGPVVLGAFAILPRDEWAAYRARRKEAGR